MHTMKNCPLCKKGKELLNYWNLKHTVIKDEPEQRRFYPYFTIEFEYEELVVLIAKGGLEK